MNYDEQYIVQNNATKQELEEVKVKIELTDERLNENIEALTQQTMFIWDAIAKAKIEADEREKELKEKLQLLFGATWFMMWVIVVAVYFRTK